MLVCEGFAFENTKTIKTPHIMWKSHFFDPKDLYHYRLNFWDVLNADICREALILLLSSGVCYLTSIIVCRVVSVCAYVSLLNTVSLNFVFISASM